MLQDYFGISNSSNNFFGGKPPPKKNGRLKKPRDTEEQSGLPDLSMTRTAQSDTVLYMFSRIVP